MSNISSAYGKIKIKGDSVESLATLLTLQAFNNSKEMDFPTCLYFGNESIDIHNVRGTNENEKAFNLYSVLLNKLKGNDITLDFSGNGRWNFCHNISCFYDCLTLENYKNKELPSFLKYLVNVAKQECYSVCFKGIDTEKGIGFLSKFKIGVYFYEGKKKIEDFYYRDIDYTNENLKKYGFAV